MDSTVIVFVRLLAVGFIGLLEDQAFRSASHLRSHFRRAPTSVDWTAIAVLLSARAGTAGDAGDATWVATHPHLNLEFEFDASGMRVQPRGAERRGWHPGPTRIQGILETPDGH